MTATTGKSLKPLLLSVANALTGSLDAIYRLILLENGMECLLISDPKTDKASASMSVKAGHLNDPVRILALFSPAH